MNDPILSIYVPTYNHENYIVQALDSILMQETSYSYEVLVGEDFSTDNTRSVLKEYEKKHPGKLTVFYRDHNMYHEIPDNFMDLEQRCRGKYVISLEGDDYWTDPLKIQKQVSFLEEHPEYIGVAHNCVVVDHNSNIQEVNYPECKDDEYSLRHFFSEIMPGQTATMMIRNIYRDDRYDRSVLKKAIWPGDRVLYFWLLLNGRVYCMQEKMTAYRLVTDHGTSFSATYKYNFENDVYYYSSLLEYARKIHHSEGCKIAEDLYFRALLQGVKHKQCSAKVFLQGLQKLSGKVRLMVRYAAYKINKDVLHKKIWI